MTDDPTDPRILANLQRMKSAGATDDDLNAYLAEEEGKASAPANPWHARYASGALPKLMAGANARDMASATESDAATNAGAGSGLAAHLLNTAQGIPGMEAVEAGAGALGSRATDHPMSYTQSLAALRGKTGEIGGTTSALEHFVGSLAVPLPKSPIAAGAVLGGADQLLSADPVEMTPEGILGRVAKTAIGAGVGGLLGHATDLGVTAIRAKRATGAAASILQRIADRADAAKALYGAALKEGAGKAPTAAVLKFVAQPDVAPIIEGLQQTRQFQGVPAHDPAMLDAVYKTLSDQMATAKKGLEATVPGKPNLGRFRVNDIGAAQKDFLDAVSAPGSETRTIETAQSPAPTLSDAIDAMRARSAEAARRARGGAIPSTNPFSSQLNTETYAQRMARELLERSSAQEIASPALSGSRTQVVETPGMMPTYPVAVSDFAKRSADIAAVQRGVDALRVAQRTTMPAGKSLSKITPEAFAKWAQGASPSEIAAAKEGILGTVKGTQKVAWGKVFGIPIVPHPSRTLNTAPGLLRLADPNDIGSRLAKYGLLGIHSMQ